MKKSKPNRVNEKRLYPSLANLILRVQVCDGSTVVKSVSTEHYVKNYFQINKSAPFGDHMPIRFVPCKYIIGDKEFIA
jgi:hypothetical protein